MEDDKRLQSPKGEDEPAVYLPASDDMSYHSRISTVNIIAAILTGTGVGLFLGLLLGLAVSPVVSGVIGTLSSLLVVLLGLNDKYLTAVKGLRIGAFGLFAVAGVLLGMYVRTNDALSPTTVDLKKQYTEAGFSEEQSLYLVSQRVFGNVPPGWFGTSTEQAVVQTASLNPHSSVLFSAGIDAGECYMLKSVHAGFPKSEVLNSFRRAGGTWEKIALDLQDKLPDQVFVDAMLVLRDSFCGLDSEGIITISTSREINGLSANDSVETIKSILKNSGDNIAVLVDNAESGIPAEHQKTFFLSIIKLLQNE